MAKKKQSKKTQKKKGKAQWGSMVMFYATESGESMKASTPTNRKRTRKQMENRPVLVAPLNTPDKEQFAFSMQEVKEHFSQIVDAHEMVDKMGI